MASEGEIGVSMKAAAQQIKASKETKISKKRRETRSSSNIWQWQRQATIEKHGVIISETESNGINYGVMALSQQRQS